MFGIGLITLCFIPIPIITQHFMAIVLQAIQDGSSVGKVGLLYYLFKIGSTHPELKRSRNIFVGGLLYVIAIFAGWIIYTSMKGI